MNSCCYYDLDVEELSTKPRTVAPRHFFSIQRKVSGPTPRSFSPARLQSTATRNALPKPSDQSLSHLPFRSVSQA